MAANRSSLEEQYWNTQICLSRGLQQLSSARPAWHVQVSFFTLAHVLLQRTHHRLSWVRFWSSPMQIRPRSKNRCSEFVLWLLFVLNEAKKATFLFALDQVAEVACSRSSFLNPLRAVLEQNNNSTKLSVDPHGNVGMFDHANAALESHL